MLAIPSEIKFTWTDLEIPTDEEVLSNLRRKHLIRPFLWQGYEWEYAWEVKSHNRKKLKKSEHVDGGVKLESVLANPDFERDGEFYKEGNQMCSVSADMPVPDKITVTWADRSDDKIIDSVRDSALTEVLTWPGYEHPLDWDVTNYSAKKSYDSDGDVQYKVVAVVEQM